MSLLLIPHYKDILERLSMPDYYYSYSKKDGDLSYWTLQTSHTIQIRCMITISGEIDLYFGKTKGQSNSSRWNSAIGKKQQNWLKQELDNADLLDQKAAFFLICP